MILPLKSLLPTATDVLNAELEDLASILLRHLKSCEGVSPVYQRSGLRLEYFLAIMERRNIGLGPLPSKEPEYGVKQPAVTRAFVEAWDWLVRSGLLIKNHEQPSDWYLISRRGETFLQNLTQKRPELKEQESKMWDVFISHASEDKAYVEPLMVALRERGVSVWYDNLLLGWGDDLRPMIDNGLRNCRFGIVVLSKAFLRKKKWTEHELNSLFAREHGRKLVLPIWHGITRDDLLDYSPGLADRLAKISENDSHAEIAKSLLDLLGRTSQPRSIVSNEPRGTATPLVGDVERVDQDSEPAIRLRDIKESRLDYDDGFLLLTPDERYLLSFSSARAGTTIAKIKSQLAVPPERLATALEKLVSAELISVEERTGVTTWSLSEVGRKFLEDNPWALWV